MYTPGFINTEGIFANVTWPFLGQPAWRGSALLDMSETNGWDEVTLSGNRTFEVPGKGIRLGPILSRDLNQITFKAELDSTFTNIVDFKDDYYVFKLMQNFPNPFNPITTISYTIPTDDFVYLKVYNLLGQEVEILVSEEKQAGTYELSFNSANLSSGLYFYQLKSGNYLETKKMILIK